MRVVIGSTSLESSLEERKCTGSFSRALREAHFYFESRRPRRRRRRRRELAPFIDFVSRTHTRTKEFNHELVSGQRGRERREREGEREGEGKKGHAANALLSGREPSSSRSRQDATDS